MLSTFIFPMHATRPAQLTQDLQTKQLSAALDRCISTFLFWAGRDVTWADRPSRVSYRQELIILYQNTPENRKLKKNEVKQAVKRDRLQDWRTQRGRCSVGFRLQTRLLLTPGHKVPESAGTGEGQSRTIWRHCNTRSPFRALKLRGKCDSPL